MLFAFCPRGNWDESKKKMEEREGRGGEINTGSVGRCLPIQRYFCAVYVYKRKADPSKGYYNPKKRIWRSVAKICSSGVVINCGNADFYCRKNFPKAPCNTPPPPPPLGDPYLISRTQGLIRKYNVFFFPLPSTTLLVHKRD